MKSTSEGRVVHLMQTGARGRRAVLAAALAGCFFAGSSALAFKPGPDIIRECPGCGQHLAQATTLSGNTFGARVWTDGRMFAPMLPERPWLAKCPTCGHVFWIDDAKQLAELWSFGRDGKWADAVRPGFPSEEEILKVLDGPRLPKEKEIYARRRAWWLMNDRARKWGRAVRRHTEAQKANMLGLAKLLDDTNDEDRLARAEIFRELGRFSTCVKLLERPCEEDEYNQAADLIRKLAMKGSRSIRRVRLRYDW